MTATAESVYDNFKKAHPDDSFLVYKFTAPGGGIRYTGTGILDINVGGNEWLTAYKLTKSSGSYMNSDEIKAKAFPFVYDTKSITDSGKRRDSLAASLKNVFPDHNVTVCIFERAWGRTCQGKGSTFFENEYGSDVDIVLN